MIYVAWVFSLAAAFYLGYHFRGLAKKIEVLEEAVKAKVDKKPVDEGPQSIIIDELDEVQVAMAEHARMMEKLNGK